MDLFCKNILTSLACLFCFANYSSAQHREVTDLEIIYGSHGVPLEYWYNETGNPETDSVPGCPKSIDGFPWIYYGDPARCFLAFHNGPCSLGQKLILQRGSVYGICACDCFADFGNSEVLREAKDKYVFCQNFGSDAPHGKVYDKENGKCYQMFQDDVNAPCENGTVITEYSEMGLTCLPYCDFLDSEWPVLQENGKCTSGPKGPAGGAAFAGVHIKHGECFSGERFSNVLRKCVKSVHGKVG